MSLLKVEGVTHWSIPVNSLDESEKFYGDLLGLKPLGRILSYAYTGCDPARMGLGPVTAIEKASRLVSPSASIINC